ncbi:hypothetical protein BpHYR1_042806 [Brachionus plicatilis]|uniref:Uncharacterized protein n=1 Tax=Brachionus plicatilis TaxID=10195 RepID=A0A3M7SQ02_BRAPC|nr:hypothetical protein BpHYR1_042806 [Brachionus plicatilis]
MIGICELPLTIRDSIRNKIGLTLRNRESFEINGLLGIEKIPKYGIKIKVIIANYVEFPDKFPLGYMHLLCSGLFKKLIKITKNS